MISEIVTPCITVKELAKQLRLGSTKAYELVASGEIASIKVGRIRRIPLTEVERWMSAKLECASGQGGMR